MRYGIRKGSELSLVRRVSITTRPLSIQQNIADEGEK